MTTLTTMPGAARKQVFDFLEVMSRPSYASLRRVNRQFRYIKIISLAVENRKKGVFPSDYKQHDLFRLQAK